MSFVIIPIPKISKQFLYGFLVVWVLLFFNIFIFNIFPYLAVVFSFLILILSLIVVIRTRDRLVYRGAIIGGVVAILFEGIFIFPDVKNLFDSWFLYDLINRIYMFVLTGGLIAYYFLFNRKNIGDIK